MQNACIFTSMKTHAEPSGIVGICKSFDRTEEFGVPPLGG